MRSFPPVEENVAAPARLSQTLLKHANKCPRSAFLYLKHRGGPATHRMMRGTLGHTFAERLMLELVSRGEPSLTADEETGGIAALTGAMMDAIVDEHPQLPVTSEDMEALRIIAYHVAIGLDVDPQTVVAIERKFVIELAGWPVSGKMDLASLPDPVTGAVDDYKTGMGIPTEQVFSTSFQTGLYSLMLVAGHPVAVVPCAACGGRGHADPALVVPGVSCDTCAGTGRIEVYEEPIGGHLKHVRARELYPRAAVRPDGTLTQRTRWRSRYEVEEFRGDAERIVRRVEHGLETGDWPAVHGNHCSECPAEAECPIPKHLRRYAGAISTPAQAAEALEWAERTSDRVNATRAEVREFAKAHGEPIVAGTDIYDFVVTHSRAIKRSGRVAAWDELEAAIDRAARYGEPFDIGEWLNFNTRTEFKKVGQIGGSEDGDGDAGGAGNGAGSGGGDAGDARSLGERFGDDAPF